MTADDPLREYRERRDPACTPEPAGDSPRASGETPLFVIQRHDASSDHYDLRLEIGGVLASWAVPKGPSTDPRVKRLAIRTEDHPLAYADFEGVIPAGEYGAGTVLVWDRGPYRNLRADRENGADMPASLRDGKVEVWLEGDKLEGGYVLIRTDSGGGDDRERWLLKKLDDDTADARRNPVSTEPRSVASDRTLEEVASQEGDGS